MTALSAVAAAERWRSAIVNVDDSHLMNGHLSRPDRPRILAIISSVSLAVGLYLTVMIYWPFGLRPWPFAWGLNPLNRLLLLGPVLLAAGLAGRVVARATAMRQRSRRRLTSGAVVRLGLAMLLASSVPWVVRLLWLFRLGFPDRAPLDVDQVSGMYGTIALISLGLPGLAIMAVGFASPQPSELRLS